MQHKNHYLLLLLSAATAIALTAVSAHAAINLTVDAADEFRDVTHAASGSLYGLTETLPANLAEFVAPLKPKMFNNPARSGQGYQQGVAAAAIPVAERLWDAGMTSTTVTIRLADLCPGWPYRYPGWNTWKSQIESVITDKRASRAKNFYGYEIWNEWHDTWRGTWTGTPQNGSHQYADWTEDQRAPHFYEVWKNAFNLIREKDPTAKIIGPSDAWFASARMKKFLTYCVQNNVVPDIVSWHELGSTAEITNRVNYYRRLEDTLGISPRPISINEYGEGHLGTEMPYEGNPGRSAAMIAKIERLGVETACISWWHTSHPGRLGSLMTTDNPPAKGAGWHFYKWYGDMSGKMITVTPPANSITTKEVDGFANIDHDKKFISILFGGVNSSDRTVNVTFNNLPSWMGTSAKVKVEGVNWKDRHTASNGPYTISENERPITNKSLTVSVTGCIDTSGYRIYLTPATAAPPCTPGVNCPNLVRDGGFPGTSLNADNWFIKNTADDGSVVASVSVSDGKATINITGVGDEVYQPQLVQTGIYPLESGKTYTLSFKASAASARTMGVVLESNTWEAYTTKTFDLTTEEQTFTHTFTMSTDDSDVQLAFNFGGTSSTENITISDVNLTQGSMTSIGGRFASANKTSARPLVSVRGRTLSVTSPNSSGLTIRMIDTRGKVVARFVGANSVRPQSFALTRIPAGRYFVEVKGAGVRQTLPVVVK